MIDTTMLYFDFIFYFPQLVLLAMALNILEIKWRHRLILALILAGIFLATVIRRSTYLEFLDQLFFFVSLCLAYAVFPICFSDFKTKKEHRVELYVSVQQTWLRLGILFFTADNAANINHYPIFETLLPYTLSIAAICIFLPVLTFRNRTWVLFCQSILSVLVIQMALRAEATNNMLLVGWTALTFLTSCISIYQGSFVVRRMAYAAFGSGTFIGALALIYFNREVSPWGAMAWTTLIFFVGFFSWIKRFPEPVAEHRALMVSNIIVQLLFLLLLWPQYLGV